MLSKAVKHLAITGAVISSLVLAVQTVLADKPGSAERVAESLRKGGKHWSVPAEIHGVAAPKPGTFVYLWPSQDCVYELKKKNGKYRTIIELQWMRPPGTQIPKSKALNVRTHIYYHNWKDSKGTTFNNTRSIIGAKSNTGKLTLHLQGGDPWEGNRELEFRVMTNDRPEQPVANYLRLVVRFGGK